MSKVFWLFLTIILLLLCYRFTFFGIKNFLFFSLIIFFFKLCFPSFHSIFYPFSHSGIFFFFIISHFLVYFFFWEFKIFSRCSFAFWTAELILGCVLYVCTVCFLFRNLYEKPLVPAWAPCEDGHISPTTLEKLLYNLIRWGSLSGLPRRSLLPSGLGLSKKKS